MKFRFQKLISLPLGQCTLVLSGVDSGDMAESTADPTQAAYAPKSGGIPLDSIFWWCPNSNSARPHYSYADRHKYFSGDRRELINDRIPHSLLLFCSPKTQDKDKIPFIPKRISKSAIFFILISLA